jgi:hypothetical protein
VALETDILMIVPDERAAHLQLILVSGDKAQLNALMRDLKNSNYLYAFSHFDDSNTLVAGVQAQMTRGAGRIPLILIINHKFAGSNCETLVRYAQEAKKNMAIECVVTDLPKSTKAREQLHRLGARLFDGDPAEMPLELSLH